MASSGEVDMVMEVKSVMTWLQINKLLFWVALLFSCSSCVVVSTAVGVTSSVVGGVVEVIDVVTPDFFAEDDVENEPEVAVKAQ